MGATFLTWRRLSRASFCRAASRSTRPRPGTPPSRPAASPGRTTRILLDGQDITDETVGTTIFNVSQGAIGDFQLNRSTQDVSGDVTSTGPGAGLHQLGNQYAFTVRRSISSRITARCSQGRPTGSILPSSGTSSAAASADRSSRISCSSLPTRSASSRSRRSRSRWPRSLRRSQAAHPSIPSPYRETYSTGRLDYNGPFSGHYFVRANYDVNLSSSNFGDGL